MKKMILNERDGSVTIDNYSINLQSREQFVGSCFYRENDDIKEFGHYGYYVESVLWLGREYSLEFWPAMEQFEKKIFMVEKGTEFYASLHDWELRANIDLLLREEARVKAFLESTLHFVSKHDISQPPYGVVFEYSWGEIAVQSNKNDFNCGLYISWND
ncbi:hypothetical protein [Pseudescherichia sp.]|uniref:hypothetical protein n=1 Tax=Pseudescherichia sp. TaxID=2055881 RepID=UPI00289818F7|nr:hypothetical protein [Pseudescherichia sp.]